MSKSGFTFEYSSYTKDLVYTRRRQLVCPMGTSRIFYLTDSLATPPPKKKLTIIQLCIGWGEKNKEQTCKRPKILNSSSNMCSSVALEAAIKGHFLTFSPLNIELSGLQNEGWLCGKDLAVDKIPRYRNSLLLPGFFASFTTFTGSYIGLGGKKLTSFSIVDR